MTEIVRLRVPMTERQLRATYPTPHDHTKWTDHRLRVAVTAQVARWLAGRVASAADLSCGDGAVLEQVDADTRYFGDFAPGYDICGPIEQTIEQLPKVDLFICAETLEHLDDPAGVLRLIRAKARLLVLSTPVGAWRDPNPEHYWAWSRAGVEQLLTDAGFSVITYACADFTPMGRKYYNFGIWGCR